jgi:hypothetical protein
MRISFNQPAFIPWGGFFARSMHSDNMVLLDDTLLSTGFTYVNRNRIKGPFGEVWISVPLKKTGRGRQKIKDLEIYKKDKWAKNFLATLFHFYGKSLHFEPVYAEIKAVVDTPDEKFLNMTLAILTTIKRILEIDTEIVLQSDLGITGKGTPLLVSTAKELKADEVLLPYFSKKAVACEKFVKEDIQVRFLRYDPPQYPQFWGSFLRRLSILDLLLCYGKEGRTIIERGSYLYEFKG